MTKTIHAIYENGVLRPIEPLDLPDRTEVEIQLRVEDRTETAPMSEGLAEVYTILGRRHSSGEHDVAARHDEHQP
jgi:predicted DNA-binding antitoxin AbrB/MazE fold protein